MTVQRAEELATIILDSGATPADLLRWAEESQKSPITIPVDVRTFLEQMGGPRLDEEGAGMPGAPAGTDGGVAAAGGGGEGAGGAGEGAGEGAAAVEAVPDAAPAGRLNPQTFTMRVLGGVGPRDYRGARLDVRALVTWDVGKTKAVVVARRLQVQVVKRRRVTDHGQKAMEVTLEIRGEQSFRLSKALSSGTDRFTVYNGGHFTHRLHLQGGSDAE